MAALRRFLQKPYDNLIIVDYICRGIPSPLLFKKFIEYLEEKHKSKVVFFKAKNKELGWHNLTSKVVFANNDVEYLPKKKNPWLQLKYEVPCGLHSPKQIQQNSYPQPPASFLQVI